MPKLKQCDSDILHPKMHNSGRKRRGELPPDIPINHFIIQTSTLSRNAHIDDRWITLAYAIVQQAIEDWRVLDIEGLDKYVMPLQRSCKFDREEITEFLLSPWCDLILTAFSLTGEDILTHLQLEHDYKNRRK